MIYLTKAVFINSCQTFIFFPSSRAYGIDPSLCRLASTSVFCVGQEEVDRGFVIDAQTIGQVTQGPPTPVPSIFKIKK